MKELTDLDLVILDSNNKPLRFHDGDIVIYNDPNEAKEDCLNGDRVVKGTELHDRLRIEIERQINR